MKPYILHKPEINQINFLDQRFYTNDGGQTYYPSVTTILEIYPKGFGFDQWLKDVGNNASEIADRAAEFGSKIHSLTEKLNNGETLSWTDEAGRAVYDRNEWESLLRFADFWKKCQPKLEANEQSFCSAKLKFGGTIDRVVVIGSKRFLIDIKTSNYLHKSHELQLAAYAMMWNEEHPDEQIEETRVLWLKSQTRTDNIDVDKGIYQGVSVAGSWQLKGFERHYTDAFRVFLHTQAIWQEENPNYKPANKILPDFISLAEPEKEATVVPKNEHRGKIEKLKELKTRAGI